MDFTADDDGLKGVRRQPGVGKFMESQFGQEDIYDNNGEVGG